MSSFTHPHRSKPVSFLCSLQKKIFWRTKQLLVAIDFHRERNTMEVNGDLQLFDYQLSSKYLLLCSALERHSYRFGTTRGWVNDDTFLIFGWTIPDAYLSVMVGNFKWQVIHFFNLIIFFKYTIIRFLFIINKCILFPSHTFLLYTTFIFHIKEYFFFS